MIRALVLCAVLAGCGGPLSVLPGGGPNVAAAVQVGQTNAQTVGKTEIAAPKIERARADQVSQAARDQVVTAARVDLVEVHQPAAFPWWVVPALFVAWELPRSSDIGRAVWRGVAWVWRRVRP